MNILFLLNGFVQVLIFGFILFKFFKHSKNVSRKKVINIFAFLGFLYLIFSVSFFLWAFEIVHCVLEDFMFLYVILIFLQSLLLFRLVYIFSKNKNLFYFLGFYLIANLFFVFVLDKFLFLSLLISFLFSLLLFIDLVSRSGLYGKLGYFGVFYSLVGLIMSGFSFIQIGNIYFFNLVLNLLFLVFLWVFFKDLSQYKIESFLKSKKAKSQFITLLSHLVFIITIVNFIFIGTIAIHEFGHYSTSKLYNCEYQKIVYENDFFHTEVLCGDLSSQSIVILGGIFLPFLLAVFLFLIGGKFLREISFLIGGFNFLAISRDLFELGVKENLIYTAIFVGALLVIYGILLFSKERIWDFYSLDLTQKPFLYKKSFGQNLINLWQKMKFICRVPKFI